MSFLSGLLKTAAGFATGGLAGAALGVAGSLFGGHKNSALNSAASDYGLQSKQDYNRYLTALQGAPNAVMDTTKAAVQNALPSYLQNLQGLRESNIRRGVSNGDLGTSTEGDLTSAFQRNIANAAAGQATNVLSQQLGGYGNLANQSSNTYLDLLAGNRDYALGQQNNSMGLLSGLIGAAGNIGASYFGNRG